MLTKLSDRAAVAGLGLGDHQFVDQFAGGYAFWNILRTGAVVRQEDDQGIIDLAGFFQGLQDAPDALIHAIDLRGIDLHAA